MKWSYDLCGAEMIIKDVPVHDASEIANGELLHLGLESAGFYTAGTGDGFASACTSTVGATIGINTLGISLEDKDTDDVPSVAASHQLTTGAYCYVKAIVNPSAVYKAQVTTADSLAITASATAGSLTQLVITALATTGMFDGQWIYFSASAGPNYGQLRKITSSASAGTVTLDSAVLNTITAADEVILISEQGRHPNGFSADAVSVGQCSTDAETATNFRVVDNYIDRGNGIELLRSAAHAGGKVNLDSRTAKVTKFYQDIVSKDHIFGCVGTT